MKKLFGTDGIRGKAFNHPLDIKTVYNLSRVVGKNLKKEKKFLIGMDPRESSPHLSSFVYSGLKSIGVEAIFLGIVSTPALSWLTKNNENIEMSVMVSASHNPYQDNGLKFFSQEGTKIPDEMEEEIENFLQNENEEPKIETVPKPNEDIKKPYRNWITSLFAKNFLYALKIVVDTANGSLSNYAQNIFEEYGAKVISIGANPDGRNINEKVGSLYPETAIKMVKETSSDLGICFDGDGDRVIFISPEGKILDGDDLLYLLALDFKEKEILKDGVVGTSMSNLGLEIALKEENINLYRTNVGDRYVYEELKNKDLYLGGEQSGHIILRNLSNTGDGLLVSLYVLDILRKKNFNIKLFKKYPQEIINLKVKEKIPLDKVPNYSKFLKKIEDTIKNGRVVIRYSGTEPLLRVMLEAEDYEKIKSAGNIIMEFYEKYLK